jgi:hypothetical protein
MKTSIILRNLTILGSALLIGAIAAWWFLQPDRKSDTMRRALISEITPMVQLCTLDVYEDMPIRGSVGSKHIFARTSVNGSVSFDLEQMEISEHGDTLFVTLPAEIVNIYESTDPNSYKVIDTWNDDFLGTGIFTTAEENAIKAKVRDNFRRRIYARGYVRQARAQAVSNLSAMLPSLTGKTVVVSDPTPNGTSPTSLPK